MKALVLSLVIVFGCVVATFAALSALNVPKELAGSASGIFLGVVPYVHRTLDRRSKQPTPALQRDSVLPLDDFALPYTILGVYGILVGIGVTQIISALGGIAGAMVAVGVAENHDAGIMPTAILVQLPSQLLVVYLVGRWIGVRSRPLGWVVATAVAFAVVGVEHVARLVWMTDAEFLELFGQARTVGMVALQWLAGTVLFWCFATLGFWRGRRSRVFRYAEYLLRKLPPQTRDTVLALLRDEVAAVAIRESVAVPRVAAAKTTSEPVGA